MKYRHVKSRRVYEIIATGALQIVCSMKYDNTPVVIYRGEDGFYWVSPEEEFHDGRFELLPNTAPENAATTGENLSASVDLSGLEALATQWERYGYPSDCYGRGLRAEIAKLRGK